MLKEIPRRPTRGMPTLWVPHDLDTGNKGFRVVARTMKTCSVHSDDISDISRTVRSRNYGKSNIEINLNFYSRISKYSAPFFHIPNNDTPCTNKYIITN